MKIQNKLILGLGTGRCGTLCLSDFLKQQPCMALCTHEHLKLKWYESSSLIDINAFDRYAAFSNSIVADVGSFLLPYVDRISEFFKETKIIVLQRDKEETIQSWMAWTNIKHNYWVPHTKGIWENDPWDPMFPKFDLEDQPKEIAIAAYYDFYYEECNKLKDKFNTLWIRTEDLDDHDTKKSICEFCGFDLSKCKLDVSCKKNPGSWLPKKELNTNTNKINENFEKFKNIGSDINQHLDTLKMYGSECDHITEMGVRGVVSTWALLAARPKKLISYDINHCDIDEVKELSEKNNIIFEFLKEDVLKIEIEKTDLLFIDTLHTYLQLKKELEVHAPKVNKYIIMHDTETFGYNDEVIYDYASDFSKSHSEKHGLNPAIKEFLETSEGKNWFIEKVYAHNNGLTILKRL